MSPSIKVSTAALSLGLLLCSTSAEANYPETAPVRAFQLPDLAGLTIVAIDLQYTTWTEPLGGGVEENVDSVTMVPRLDVTLAPHWQVFAAVPLAHADIETTPVDTGSCCGWSLGNLTLGGRYLFSERYRSGLRSVMGGDLSLSLPTASDDGDGAATAFAAAAARSQQDPGSFLPDTWTARLTLNRQVYTDRLMVQVEGGLHFWFYDGDVPDDDLDLGLRLAVAGGVRLTPEVALIAELNSLFFFNVGEDDVDDDLFASLDFGVRYGGEQVLVGARFYFPIDDAARDLDMLGFGVDLGVRL